MSEARLIKRVEHTMRCFFLFIFLSGCRILYSRNQTSISIFFSLLLAVVGEMEGWHYPVLSDKRSAVLRQRKMKLFHIHLLHRFIVPPFFFYFFILSTRKYNGALLVYIGAPRFSNLDAARRTLDRGPRKNENKELGLKEIGQ